MSRMQPGYEFTEAGPRSRTDYEARETRGDEPFAVIDMPGAFETYWTGSGVMAGEPYSADEDMEVGARLAAGAFRYGKTIKRGMGCSIRMKLYTREAVEVLLDYAETCATANRGGDMEWSEYRAALSLAAGCREALA
jgi:hypothetical protein